MYHHHTRDTRTALATLKRAGLSHREIGRELGMHHTTVGRELERNARERGSYHASYADARARRRRTSAKRGARRIENDSALAHRIERRLSPLVSPKVVAHEEGIHHQTVYDWVYRSRADLLRELPQRGRKRRRYGSKRAAKQGWTRHVRPIDERVEDGPSWEGDTVKGKSRARILTHVERESLYLDARLLPDGTADAVHATLRDAPLPGTYTYDRGSEFALWRMIEEATGATVFFAHPHAPWERGKNENTNGRLRRVFPKRFDFGTITAADLAAVVDLMNDTPRESLGWRKPRDVFKERWCTSR